MKILPTLAEVREIASDVNYNVLPVSCEILSDFTTPIEIIKILKNVSTHCYMLESAQANETWGRYTFLGFDPKMEINFRFPIFISPSTQVISIFGSKPRNV